MLGGVLRALGVPMVKDQRGGAGTSPQAAGGAADERQGGADIFVGGGFDDIFPGSAMSEYVKDYACQTGRPVQYVPNNRVGQVVNAIRDANRNGGPVNVVGHSYGGPDAYNAAAIANRQGLRVDNLITIDPVSGPSRRVIGTAQPGAWLNLQAHSDHPDFSDRLTGIPWFAHKPSALPIAQADQSAVLKANHRDVEDLMAKGGGRELLDRSRKIPPNPAAAFYRPPTAPELHDNLPMMAWIRRRQAQAGGGQ